MRLIKNISIFSLPPGSRELKLLVFLACAGIFTNALPNATLTRQKQGVVALVKKHPIASIMLVGTAWFVYKMIRSYRRTGSVASALPEWFFSLRDRYKRWKNSRVREEELRRQAEQAADRRTPQPSKASRSAVFTSSECRADSSSAVVQSSSSDWERGVRSQYPQEPVAVQVQDNRDRYFSDYVALDTVNDYKARTFFEAAIQGKNPREQNNIGLGFLDGIGVAQDRAKAITLFEAAAKQEFADAQFNLAKCYLMGLGVRKNLSKSLSWFCKALGNGNLDSLALMYHISHRGIFVPKDDTFADVYFKVIKNIAGSEAAARKKLSESELYTEFDKSVVSKDFAGEKCSICQEVWPSVEQDASVSILPCRHCFCQDCFVQWSKEQEKLMRETTCPLCRLVVQPQKIIIGVVV